MATSHNTRRTFLKHVSAAGWVLAGADNFINPSQVGAEETLPALKLNDSERIVFLGDSITQGGNYVAYLETLLRLRFPTKSLEIHNHGISSETISGTSEPDHDPRRPWAHERFSRDVADWRPTLVFSCFGMNDGNYHPFEKERFEKYQAGINRLIERTEKEAGTQRLVISTPPPFDAYQRGNGDKNAVHYGYKYPAIDYDETLARYSEWLLTLQKQGRNIIDLHGPLNRHLAERRKKRVSFTLMPDAVHPNSAGHAVMAITMAKALGLDTNRDELVIDGNLQKPVSAKHGQAQMQSGDTNQIKIEWKTPAAWAFGPDVDAETTALEGVDARFNRLMLKIESPRAGKYNIEIMTGNSVAGKQDYSFDDLASGVDIAPLLGRNSAERAAGVALSNAVMQHRQASSAAWRARVMKLARNDEKRGPQLEELAREAEAAAKLSALASQLHGPLKITITRHDG